MHEGGLRPLKISNNVAFCRTVCCEWLYATSGVPQVVGLMRMVPESEDDALAKTALFTKYVEVLPTALENWQQGGLGMVFDLLAAIQDVVLFSQQQHQNLFR